MKKLIVVLVLLLVACGGNDRKSSQDSTEVEAVDESVNDLEVSDKFICPDDCENGFEYEEEDSCPICGKDLILVDGSSDNSGRQSEEDNKDEDQDHESQGEDQFSNNN